MYLRKCDDELIEFMWGDAGYLGEVVGVRMINLLRSACSRCHVG